MGCNLRSHVYYNMAQEHREVWLPQTIIKDAGLVTEVLCNVKGSCGLAQDSCPPCVQTE